ncbi:MAG: DNA-processing protein DprA [Candidatus Zixiibacteriota bacterium]
MNLTNSELKTHLINIIGLLRIPGIGRGRYHRLVRALGAPAAVLSASKYELEAVSGIPKALTSDIKEQFDREAAAQIASRIVQLGWAVLFVGHAEYPQPLLSISDHPPLLFREGGSSPDDTKIMAIVGTRRPTESGKRFAAGLAAELARAGITVVSGLAEGIDSAAHYGALQAGGKTIAVLGNSLDYVYPRSNKKLAARIREQGALYSEYFPGTRPDPAHFPERNRLISGLSEGVVVVEAGAKSGALLTAAHALEQGRELFAVPGSPEARMSIGTNMLIKRGARLVTSIDDIFEELPRLKGDLTVKRVTQMPDITEMERQIVGICSEQPVQIDVIARKLDLPTAEVMEFLLALELKGIVQELSGKRFILCEDFR